MKIILSPAKLMRSYFFTHDSKLLFKKQTSELMFELKKWTNSDLVRNMKLSEDKAQETFQIIQNWGTKKNKLNSAPAIFAYIGEAYKALAADNLSEPELTYFSEHLLILSGLYGVLRATDLVEPYRLEMAQRGVAPEGQSLYHFWRNDVEKLLIRSLNKEEGILNLASTEYSDLIQLPKLRDRMYTPHFFEQNKDVLKVVSVYSKQARGTMARWCASQKIAHPLEVKRFRELGYQFSPEKSTANDMVFIR
jgi:cytoplasmic iron level regulating protein YaaA (DUF328/UPF0246 family)